MRLKKIAAELIALLALLPTHALAATITPVLGCEGGRDKSCYSIWIIGVIQLDDDMKFNQVIESNKITKAIVVLNSPGGNVLAGLAIGRTIKEKNFTTGLIKDGLCTSVCGAIWLAGSRRYVMAGSHIGFHAAYYKDQQGRIVETGVGNALVGAYYARLGLSNEAIVYLTKSGPYAMTWLKADDAKKLGITAEIIDPNKKPIWDVEGNPYKPAKTIKFNEDGIPVPVGAEAEPPSTPQLDLNNIEDAKRVQRRLIDLDFLFGSVDGIWGPLSRQALEDFRVTQEIGPGDTWDETTQQLLFGDSAVRAPSAPQSFVGGWGVDLADCRQPQGGRGHLTITARRAEAFGTACEFQSVQDEGANMWRLQARCANSSERWNANIRFRIFGNRLTWSSERGTVNYVRCSG